MNILVTGAGGMIGSHLVETLAKSGNHVIGTYYKPTINMKEIRANVKLIECDVRYPKTIENIIKDFLPERIFHLAAQSYPSVSWERPFETIETNIMGTVSVFEAIKCVRELSDYDPVVVVACSSAEYGKTLDETEGEKVLETAELKPLHPYGVSKVGQDLLSYQYWENDKIRSIRARIFNTTGVRKVNDVTSDFTKRAVEQKKQGTNQLIVGNIHTERAILDVEDLINALMLLAEKGKSGEAYNISAEKTIKVKTIIELIEKQLNKKFELVIDEHLLRPTDEKIIIGDISKLQRDTGWKQKVTIEETIEHLLAYWENVI